MRRECDECGEWYGRCNKVIIWAKQNPGHVFGWIKITRIVCTKCMPENRVKSMINRVQPYFGEARLMLPTRNMLKVAMKQFKRKKKG